MNFKRAFKTFNALKFLMPTFDCIILSRNKFFLQFIKILIHLHLVVGAVLTQQLNKRQIQYI